MGKKKAKNFGYGKRIGYAVNQALRERHGDGQFGTVSAHRNRFKVFRDFLKERGVNDLADVSLEMVEEYATQQTDQVAEGLLAAKTVKNRISTVNVVLGYMRGDQRLNVRPSQFVGRLNSVRKSAPLGLDIDAVEQAVTALDDNGQGSVAMAIRFARGFGVRVAEAGLMDLRRVAREARRTGSINIIDGTKGGRKVDRWVRVGSRGKRLIEQALADHSETGKLVGDSKSFKSWYDHSYYELGKVAPEYGVSTKFHDLRSAWACDRYLEETGFPAPVIAGHRVAPKHRDAAAREKLAIELGHGRAQVLASYIGGVRGEPKK